MIQSYWKTRIIQTLTTVLTRRMLSVAMVAVWLRYGLVALIKSVDYEEDRKE